MNERDACAHLLQVVELQKTVSRLIEKSRMSQRRWASAQGINHRDLSFLLNHFSRLVQKRETISENKLAELIRRFLPETGEVTR